MKRTLLFIGLLFITTSCFAQTNKTEFVNKLMKIMQMEQKVNNSAEQMLEIQTQSMPQLNQYKDIMLDFFHKYLNWEKMGDQIKNIYKTHFTVKEMKDLIAFYQTDTGQKLIQVQPKIKTQMAKISQQVMMNHQAELRQKIMEAMSNKDTQ